MKLINFSIPVIWDSIVAASSRFPLAIISAVCFTIISIFQIHTGINETEPELQRLMFSLAIGLPWLVFIHLFNEKYTSTTSYKYGVFGFGILFLIIIYIYIAPDFELERLQRPVRFLSFFLISHLLVSTVLFFKTNNLTTFWEFNKNLLLSWCAGALYVLVIFSGLVIALLAIDNLFEVALDSKYYIYLFLITACIYHPIYFLSSFPKLVELDKQEIAYSKAIRAIVYYIFIPMSILYFLILYAYGFKILVAWNLPKGWVSSLVLGFSGMGIFTYLLNYCLSDVEENKFSKVFKKYFYFALTPLVLLLFIAIYRRLSDYGFTPPRYFVFISGIWLILICFYFLISKSDNIKWIPISLVVVLFVGTMSPIDAFKISAASQKFRLISKLNELNVLTDGKIKESLIELKDDDKAALREMIQVIDETGFISNLSSIWPKASQLDSVSNSNLKDSLFIKLGLRSPSIITEPFEMIYLNESQTNAIEINNYDFMYLFNLNAGSRDENIFLDNGGRTQLKITKNINDSLNLDSLVVQIEQNVKTVGNEKAIDSPFDIETSGYQYRIFIKQINYKRYSAKLELDYLHAILLCRVKK